MGFLKFLLISTGTVVGTAAVAVGATLVVTGLPTKDIDVQWNENHWESYLVKTGAEYTSEHASAEDMVANNIIETGVVPVDATFINEELTAAANKTTNDNSVMKDIKIKCNSDGTVEASCVIGSLKEIMESNPSLEKYSFIAGLIKNRPVYLKSTLSYEEGSGIFKGDTTEVRIGKLKVPVSWVAFGLEDVASATNKTLSSLGGFTVENFAVKSGGMEFKGTLPEQVDSDGPF